MEIYSYNFTARKQSLTGKLAAALIFGGSFFLFRFSWIYFWPDQFEAHRGHLSMALEVGVVAIVFGIGNAFFPKFGMRSIQKGMPPYKLLVDDDSITGYFDYKGQLKFLLRKRSVRKGHVRSVIEIKGRFGAPSSIRISEKTGFNARMFDYVFISSALPEFEHLKQLAERWRTVDPNN